MVSINNVELPRDLEPGPWSAFGLALAGAWVVSHLLERTVRGRDPFSRRAKVASWTFAPGVVLHELAHAAFHVAATFRKPSKVTLLRSEGGLANGLVVPNRLESPGASVAVAFAPLLVLAPLAWWLASLLWSNWSRLAWDLRALGAYLLVSILACSRPSGPDLKLAWAVTKRKPGAFAREAVAVSAGLACAYLGWHHLGWTGAQLNAAVVAFPLAWLATSKALCRPRDPLDGGTAGRLKAPPPPVPLLDASKKPARLARRVKLRFS
ncbi:MAG: hypothetical protein Kow0069_34140 [Promethearchaeota archaeon]